MQAVIAVNRFDFDNFIRFRRKPKEFKFVQAGTEKAKLALAYIDECVKLTGVKPKAYLVTGAAANYRKSFTGNKRSASFTYGGNGRMYRSSNNRKRTAGRKIQRIEVDKSVFRLAKVRRKHVGRWKGREFFVEVRRLIRPGSYDRGRSKFIKMLK